MTNKPDETIKVPVYTCVPNSKQVLKDGAHFCDAGTPDSSQKITHAMNFYEGVKAVHDHLLAKQSV